MGLFSKLFGSNGSKAKAPARRMSGKDTVAHTGAGPAMAAHSKDAQTTRKSGQNGKAAAKR